MLDLVVNPDGVGTRERRSANHGAGAAIMSARRASRLGRQDESAEHQYRRNR